QEGRVAVASIGREAGLELLQADEPVSVFVRIDHELGGGRKALVLLRCGLARVGRERRHVDKAGDLRMDSGFGDDRSSPAVPNQEDAARLSIDHSTGGCDVVLKGGQGNLDDRNAVAASGQVVIYPAPA